MRRDHVSCEIHDQTRIMLIDTVNQERAKASQGKGKLGRQLDAQKSQTQAGALAQTSRDNRAARDADAAADARNYN